MSATRLAMRGIPKADARRVRRAAWSAVGRGVDRAGGQPGSSPWMSLRRGSRNQRHPATAAAWPEANRAAVC